STPQATTPRFAVSFAAEHRTSKQWPLAVVFGSGAPEFRKTDASYRFAVDAATCRSGVRLMPVHGGRPGDRISQRRAAVREAELDRLLDANPLSAPRTPTLR